MPAALSGSVTSRPSLMVLCATSLVGRTYQAHCIDSFLAHYAVLNKAGKVTERSIKFRHTDLFLETSGNAHCPTVLPADIKEGRLHMQTPTSKLE